MSGYPPNPLFIPLVAKSIWEDETKKIQAVFLARCRDRDEGGESNPEEIAINVVEDMMLEFTMNNQTHEDEFKYQAMRAFRLGIYEFFGKVGA